MAGAGAGRRLLSGSFDHAACGRIHASAGLHPGAGRPLLLQMSALPIWNEGNFYVMVRDRCVIEIDDGMTVD